MAVDRSGSCNNRDRRTGVVYMGDPAVRRRVCRGRGFDRPITTAWGRFLDELGCRSTFDFCIQTGLMAVGLFAVWMLIVVVCACAQPPFGGR